MSKGSKKVTIGFKYYMGLHMILCHGPVDAILAINAGKRNMYTGTISSNSTIQINKPDLFGGEKKEGGITGDIDIMMGGATQAQNAYLVSKIGSLLPAFRGVVSVVCKGIYLCAMSPYPKPWDFVVKRIPGKSWYNTGNVADINNGSANPAHVIYEALTDTSWGMGYPTGSIDETTFRAAADTLKAEGLGVSLILTKQDTIESFIYTVLAHINAMLYTRPDNGKFSLKLTREDYVVASLQLFDESNVIKLSSFERPLYSEVTNEIVVQYRQRGTAADNTVAVQDLAAVAAQYGVVSQTIQYPGLDNATNAQRAALRDLRQRSTPFSRVKCSVNRQGWNQTIGNVIRFSWAEYDLVEVPMRIMNVNYGDLVDGTIELDLVEDMFGMPTTTYMGEQTSGWVNPIQPPVDFPLGVGYEATYWDVALALPEAELAAKDSTSAFLTACFGETSAYIPAYELWSGNSGALVNTDNAVPTPHGTLSAAITHLQTSFTLTAFTTGFEDVEVGTYAYVDNEIMRVDSVNGVTGDVTVGRGCLDTIPATHSLGARMWFAEHSRAEDPTERAATSTVYFKGLPHSGEARLAEASATQRSVTFNNRFWRPYVPGQFAINGNQYAATVITGPLVITWANRNRQTQLIRPITGFTNANITPEAGVTHSINIYGYSPDPVSSLKAVTGITGSLATWSWGSTEAAECLYSNIRVTLKSTRDSLDSYQTQDWHVVRAGLGFNLGNYLGGI